MNNVFYQRFSRSSFVTFRYFSLILETMLGARYQDLDILTANLCCFVNIGTIMAFLSYLGSIIGARCYSVKIKNIIK